MEIYFNAEIALRLKTCLLRSKISISQWELANERTLGIKVFNSTISRKQTIAPGTA